MVARLNPTWTKEVLLKIAQQQMRIMNQQINSAEPLEWVLNNNLASGFVVQNLTTYNVPFKVLNMGAGIKKITTDVNVCPKCKGTGKC